MYISIQQVGIGGAWWLFGIFSFGMWWLKILHMYLLFLVKSYVKRILITMIIAVIINIWWGKKG